jgi:hypothetical protein
MRNRDRKRRLEVVGMLSAALLVAATLVPSVASGSGASVPAAAPGVTEDTITIVALAADVDGLRDAGVELSPQLTVDNIIRRAQGYADEFGPINGRRVVVERAVWNPVDVTTFDSACTTATQDNQPFLVINGAGFRSDSIACITVDNKTPMFHGESAYGTLFEGSGKNLVTLGLPSEVIGATTASVAHKAKLISKSSKIGILAANEPGKKIPADVLEAELKRRGYDVVERVDINTLLGNLGAINRESSASVATLQAAGVDTVFLTATSTNTTGYFQELARSNAGFKNFLVDVSSTACDAGAADRLPAEAEGTPCITATNTAAVPTKDGVRQDGAFEAKCRSQYDAITGWNTVPGAKQGGVDANGVHFDEDYPFAECNIMSVLLPAIKAAGKNPTWAKVQANLLEKTKAPAASLSGGEGGFGANKPYFAKQVHVVVLNQALNAPQDANGVTYNGCPMPISCFVPQLVNGREWFPAVMPKATS